MENNDCILGVKEKRKLGLMEGLEDLFEEADDLVSSVLNSPWQHKGQHGFCSMPASAKRSSELLPTQFLAFYFSSIFLFWTLVIVFRSLAKHVSRRSRIRQKTMLPTHEVLGSEAEEDCPICMEPCSGRVCDLPCKHSFHAECLDQWFDRSLTCPLCRLELIPFDDD